MGPEQFFCRMESVFDIVASGEAVIQVFSVKMKV